MKLPPLNALRSFEATARLGSVARAAQALNVTHAAVSHQIKHLETWFGQPLFHRRGRGLVLSAAGQRLQETVSEALGRIAQTSEAIRRDRRRAITVGCIPSIASRWLIPLLPSFMQAHPEIDVQVRYAAAQDRLRTAGYDVLVTLGPDPDPGTESRVLFSRVNMPVCSRHFLAEHGPADSPAWFTTLPLLHDESREGWRTWFAAAGLPEAAVENGPVFQDFNLLSTALIAGHGVALCPVEVLRQELERGDLVVVSSQTILADERYVVIVERVAAVAAKAFADWFAEAVQQGG